MLSGTGPAALLGAAGASDPVTRNLTVESTKLPKPLNSELPPEADALFADPRSQRKTACLAHSARNLPLSVGEALFNRRKQNVCWCWGAHSNPLRGLG